VTAASFDPVVDAYDRARPSYPPGVYDALEAAVGRVAGSLVLDGGAGTGIASRALARRGARVVSFDVGGEMLRRARRRAPHLPAVVADGNRLPFATGVADLVCFAQAWHWLDAPVAAREAARVLRPGGWWAGWWSHVRADGEAWFERYQSLLESRTAYDRHHRDRDWGAGVTASGHFGPATKAVVGWTRRVGLDTWLVDERSKSYVAGLAPGERTRLLGDVEALLRDEFGGGEVVAACDTWLWTAQVRAMVGRAR
jgi:SAM-dependent methyltransferase